MSIQRGGSNRDSEAAILQTVTDIAAKVFQITLVTTIVLLGWLLWGLFSGKLADTPHMPHAAQVAALHTVQSITMYLQISLVVNLVCVCILFYDIAVVPIIMLLIAAALAYGLPIIADLLGIDKKGFSQTGASATGLKTIYFCAMALTVPGVILVLRNIVVSVFNSRHGNDLTSEYGTTVTPDNDKPRGTLGVLEKCWQTPFCRAGVRKTCPIYHARTKCWKQQVGCMCEENIIRLAMRDDKADGPPTVEMQRNQGFVALGDLISSQEKVEAKSLPTKEGPRGVRIPVNPNLTFQQKRLRCHNCIIYNEHQRNKYKFFAPVVSLAVPLLVYLNYETVKNLINGLINAVGSIFSKVTFDTSSHGKLANQITGSFTVELVFAVVFTLIVMTYALKFLEYCMFKIKI